MTDGRSAGAWHVAVPWWVAACLASALWLSACSAARPVLYPNATYREMGWQGAQNDVDHCLRVGTHHAGRSQPKAAARTPFGALLPSYELSPSCRRLVEMCLRERGYEPMGWR